jgi:hypothetical protein
MIGLEDCRDRIPDNEPRPWSGDHAL